eukprot:2363161-Prymnesium_polylepis.1
MHARAVGILHHARLASCAHTHRRALLVARPPQVHRRGPTRRHRVPPTHRATDAAAPAGHAIARPAAAGRAWALAAAGAASANLVQHLAPSATVFVHVSGSLN